MYIEECLVRGLHAERLKRARQERTAQRLSELSRLERQRQRAERELLRAWQRADRLRAMLGASS